MPEANPRMDADAALKQADRAARRGDFTQADRWSKTAERMIETATRLDGLAPGEDPTQDEAELQAELRRRLQRFVEADQDIQRWEREAELFEAQLWAAIANGTPPPAPLRKHPASPLDEETYMTTFLLGPEPNDGLKV